MTNEIFVLIGCVWKYYTNIILQYLQQQHFPLFFSFLIKKSFSYKFAMDNKAHTISYITHNPLFVFFINIRSYTFSPKTINQIILFSRRNNIVLKNILTFTTVNAITHAHVHARTTYTFLSSNAPTLTLLSYWNICSHGSVAFNLPGIRFYICLRWIYSLTLPLFTRCNWQAT